MKRTETIVSIFQALRADVAFARWSYARHIRRDIPIAATIIGLTMVVSVAISAAASQYAGTNSVAGPMSLEGVLLVVTQSETPAIADAAVIEEETALVADEAAILPEATSAETMEPSPPATTIEESGDADPELVAKLRARTTTSKAEATDTSITTQSVINNVNITFYDCATQNFCGHMYGGRVVHEGAAACSWNLALGTQFHIVGDPTGRTYTCEDRGLLTNTWVDIFFYSQAAGYRWAANVPRVGTIEITYRP